MNPLFVPSLTDLKSQLRLSGSTSGDADEIINSAIREVRVGFYNHLGATRVTTIVGYTPTDTPTTSNEILRSQAQVTETKWVKMLLLRSLPSHFLDASGDTRNAWNEEGLTRDSSQADLSREIKRLNDEVLDALKDLKEGEVDPGIVSATVIESDTAPARPFQSIGPVIQL